MRTSMTTHLVVILADLRGGGAELAVLNILRHINRAAYRITLLLLKNEGVYWEQIPQDVEVICCLQPGERIHRHPWKFFKRFVHCVKRADVVVGGIELTPTYLAALAGWILRKPSIGILHIILPIYLNRMPRWHRIAVPVFYRMLTHLVTVSEGVRDSLVRIIPEVHHRVTVIYNIACERQQCGAEKSSVPKGRIRHPCLLGVGRLDYRKGFDILFTAHRLLTSQGWRIQTIILGDGPERAALYKLAQELAIDGDVMLPGFVPDPEAWMREADVFILSSRLEGLPLVLLEAMRNSLPVIATDCPSGPREILQDGMCGMLVPVNDAGALARAIALMLSDTRIRERYRAAGSKRANDFSPSAIVPLWEKLFEEITM